MKKILILANNSGGVFFFRRELISEMMKYVDVKVSTPFDDKVDELQEMGLQLIQTEFERRGLNPIKDILLLRFYYLLTKKEKPDLVITYTIKPNIYGGIICRLLKISYAANITGLGTAFVEEGLLRKIVTLMYRVSLRKAKVVFFENSSNAQLFIDEKIICPVQKCVLNGAGVNLEYFCVQPYPDNQVFRFLFIGRIMAEKGVNELFQAIKRLRDRGFACSLDILGGMEEGFQKMIDNYEKEGWLRYHGVQMDVRPFIAQCDCFVLPSWHEGMANTNLECAASGRPIITSNIPGCKEAVIDGISGFLCEPKNIDDLYINLKRIIVIPKYERKKMGIAGRKHIEKVFDKKIVVQKTINELEIKTNY